MSLKVPAALLEQAGYGEVAEADFVACILESLPYAWGVVSSLAGQAHHVAGAFAEDQAPPPNLEAQGQLLRMMASDAMRAALECHFGVRVAFQVVGGRLPRRPWASFRLIQPEDGFLDDAVPGLGEGLLGSGDPEARLPQDAQRTELSPAARACIGRTVTRPRSSRSAWLATPRPHADRSIQYVTSVSPGPVTSADLTRHVLHRVRGKA